MVLIKKTSEIRFDRVKHFFTVFCKTKSSIILKIDFLTCYIKIEKNIDDPGDQNALCNGAKKIAIRVQF